MESFGFKPLPIKVTKVSAGETAILKCNSNDRTHNFMFWQLNQDQIIGPKNTDYDETKYKYEVLSGKLFIKAVSPEESGLYKCVSQSIENQAHNVGTVDLMVNGDEANTVLDAVKLVCIIVSIIVIIGCAVIYYKLRKDWKRYDGRAVVPAEDMDEDDEGEEIYARTTTTAPAPPGPSRNVSTDQLLGFDNPALETDFNNVFEQIKIKAPPRSLI